MANTIGCGGCLDLEYCEAFGGNTDFDYIDKFSFAEFVNASGDNQGFGDFTGMDLPHAERDRTYTVSIVPGMTGVELDENYIVWIDYNADGIFASTEKVLVIETKDTLGASLDITIPNNAVLGSTRMRVAMRFARDPIACDDSGTVLGEYEDYCLTIDENSGVGSTEQELIQLDVYPNPVYDQFVIRIHDYSIARGRITIIDHAGKIIRDYDADLLLDNDKIVNVSEFPAGMFIVRFATADGNYVFTKKLIKL
jgi:hypothetical protein